MNFSAEHNNWLAVGEMIRAIQKPISSYVGQIVKDFHAKLCQDFDKNCKCKDASCKNKTPSCGLCTSCSEGWWLSTLKATHEKGNNPSWRQNCDNSKWYHDHWEVAKFFMPKLGNNKTTVKDAESTDLSSLLNVLEWMKDDAFLGKTRVNVDFVRELRSNVRNTWAHAPAQELSEQQKEDSFTIAAEFLEDLKNVFPEETAVIEDTLRCLDHLKAHGVRDIVKSEIENLLLTFNILSQTKEALVLTQKDSLTDQKAIEDLRNQLDQVKNAMSSCLKRMEEFRKLKDNINQQFESFKQQLQFFCGGISGDISDINQKIQLMSTDIKDIKKMTKLRQDKEKKQEVRSCLPEKLQNFTARAKEIEDLVKFLKEKNTGIVSLHGGPGFGKSALAVEVSHRLSDDHNFVVIFTDMSTASSIDEVTMRICRDVGINFEEDPRSSQSSLSLLLKKLKKEVVFVWDDIDNLLESDVRSEFDDFIRLLRKNSNQQLKLLTTSRASYTVQGLSCQKIQVKEMDKESGIALLKSISHDHNDEFLRSLAQLCGYIPLAMCIAISLVNNFENPQEIIQHLEDQPMTILSNSETNQFVYKAFNTSYIHLTNEQRDALLRLTVFEGDFSEDAAKAVLEGHDSKKKVLLIHLVNRSLVKKSGSHRYSIHVLIRSFLSQQPEGVQERAKAETLMVAYYLDLCNRSTIESYSKDKFMENREILTREAHNIETVLTICTRKRNEHEIRNVFVDSEIYKRSCRFFYNIVKTIISENVLTIFLQSCGELANAREERSNKINFGCILADQEGRKSFWKSDQYLEKMKATEEEFEKYKDDLTGDVALQAYFFYQLGRYFLNQSKVYKDNVDRSALMNLLDEADKHLHKSLGLGKKLQDSFPDFPLANVNVILSLMQLGNLRKKISTIQRRKDDDERQKSTKKAEEYYEEAIKLAENNLGKHEISATCYKILGDLFLQTRQNEKAMKNYEMAKSMREELSLNTSEEYALLLNNIGRSLMFTQCSPDAIDILEIAQDIAEKLVDDDCPTVGKGKIYTSLARSYKYSNTNPGKAKELAEKALKINKENNNPIMTRQEIHILQTIINS